METIRINVQSEETNRLDSYIASKIELSRSKIQELIKSGMVLVNGTEKKAKYLVLPEDKIDISIPEQKTTQLIPQELSISVIWEDDHIIVVNKPAGMVVYPAPGHRDGTLLNALLFHFGTLAPAGGTERPGVVHRIDRDTSGLLVVAKSDLAYQSLTEQFQKRLVKKHYRSLVYGQFPEDSGRFCKAIGRNRYDRKRMSIRTDSGKEAITDFLVMTRYKNAMLVDVEIITGRTHQIRVHFASSGHPILGDPVYGRKTVITIGKKDILIPRQMLHAYSLGLVHPEKKTFMTFTAPLSEDFLSLAGKLKGE